MPNITISIDENLLEEGRRYARTHRTSLNALIRRLLEHTVKSESGDWMDEMFELMDQADVHTNGIVWRREDLYDG